ncbi:Serine/threonine-protein phosphatase 1 [Symmachiella macrocystis]|uniref:Serine/threonine-protein phosphatase 1 n=1 Tax=Symmachiella macrocystis TaxID=2527985 RepID=A0A5C6BBQ9_9PLAN|nr:metallophosphoesterase family protein [Symmachiella macrocystis]TWU09122.1 Serine/threonine-protein phosphatase 1 [Symmachiella macrocystis]
MPGRTLAIGDIHGCDHALDTLLTEVDVQPDDTVVVLGDAVDRGPGTKQVIDRLLQLRQQCHLLFIMGNHEEMFLNAMAGGEWLGPWMMHGGREALESYGGSFDDVPEEHYEFMRSGLNYVDTPRDIFVHANLTPSVPLEQQPGQALRWERLTAMEPPWPTGQRVICGHSPQMSGDPLVFPGWVGIDTMAYAKHGWLTCLDTGTNIIYQANQSGHSRTGYPQ